jgi:heat shock protein HslJ
MYNIGILIVLLLFGGSGMAADQYIHIASPVDGDIVDPVQPLLVSGTGRGLFEGNVVVRIEDPAGKQLLQVPTTLKRNHIADAGQWQVSIMLPAPVPATIRLLAYSPSPKEGDPAITSRAMMLTTQQQSGLEDSDWLLGRYRDVSGQMTDVLSGTRVTARFKDGKLSGNAGCNRYFGIYKREAEYQLSFSTRTGVTMMACAPPVTVQEQQYLKNLSVVTGFQEQNGGLLLLGKDDQVLLEYTAMIPLGLENTLWQAAGINNGKGGVVSTENTHLATARFIDGKVTGHAGCNTFNATYEVMDKRINIGPAMATRMHCAEPEGILAQEQDFLQALSRARVYEIDDTRLKLRDDKGALQVDFVVEDKDK